MEKRKTWAGSAEAKQKSTIAGSDGSKRGAPPERLRDKKPQVLGCGLRPRVEQKPVWCGAGEPPWVCARAGGVGWARVGWILSLHPGRRVSGWLLSKVTRDSVLPALVLRARAGRAPLAAQSRATGHLRGEDKGAAAGTLARGSAAPRGLSSRGSAGSAPSQCSACSSDLTLKGNGPDPARSLLHVLSPTGFMPSDAGAMRWPAGAGLAGLSRRDVGPARRDTAGGSTAPPPSEPYKKAAPLSCPALQSPLSLPRGPRRPLVSLTREGGTADWDSSAPAPACLAHPCGLPRARLSSPGALRPGWEVAGTPGEHEALAPASPRAEAHSGRDLVEPRSGHRSGPRADPETRRARRRQRGGAGASRSVVPLSLAGCSSRCAQSGA